MTKLVLKAAVTESPQCAYYLEVTEDAACMLSGTLVTGSNIPIVELPGARWCALHGEVARMLIREIENHGRVYDPHRNFTKLLWYSLSQLDSTAVWSIDEAVLSRPDHSEVHAWA